jgi:hypothetical protein
MLAKSELYTFCLPIDPPDLRGETLPVYTGFTTYLVEAQPDLTISNYTPIIRRLALMGCMRQLQRGGRGMPSRWALLKEPSPLDFSRSRHWQRSEKERLAVVERKVEELEQALREVS